MNNFMTLTTVAWSHIVAVRKEAVRIIEDILDPNEENKLVGVQVTLLDGTTYLVQGSVAELIKQLEN